MPYIPSSLTTAVSIDQGIITTVINSATLANIGVSRSQVFGVPPGAGGGYGRSADYEMIPTGAVTTLTVTLQASQDGGITWQNRGAAIDLVALPAGNIAPLVCGVQYRIAITTFTGAGSFVLDLAAS